METILTSDPAEAADLIRHGGTVAFPTETVYGLGANVFDETAIAKIFEAKRRPADNPLIAHISDLSQLRELTSIVPDTAQAFIKAFFPGPLTLVLTRSVKVPLLATAGLETVGVRMPSFPMARDFLRACGVAVVAPSANLSGKPSPTTWEAVFEDLDGRIDGILKGDATEIGLESTVVDCTSSVPILLRQGAVSIEALRRIVPGTGSNVESGMEARSPGLKHVHYAPAATVTILRRGEQVVWEENSAFIGLENLREFEIAEICTSVEDYAHTLFEFFRKCDRRGIRRIYCESVAEVGIGAALMDRLRRAASK